MPRRTVFFYLTIGALFIGLVALSQPASAAAARQPNILFIFSDDHAYQAISAYGDPRQLNQTPNIDRLAKELALILNRPDIREKFVKAGLPVVAEGPEVFRARIAREVPMYKDIIDKAGLKIQ